MTSQISKQLKKGAPQWSDEARKAVADLKQKCSHLPPLKIPDNGQLILQTDASEHYWGALLIEDNNGHRTVCGYKSGQFNTDQSHYPPSKREVLAVVKGIKKFQFFLSFTPFIVETDYKYLEGLLRRKEGEIPDPQLARWSESLSRFKFEVRHIKGESNTVADFLSRPIMGFRKTPSEWGEGTSTEPSLAEWRKKKEQEVQQLKEKME